jgi:hypothetical protein
MEGSHIFVRIHFYRTTGKLVSAKILSFPWADARTLSGKKLITTIRMQLARNISMLYFMATRLRKVGWVPVMVGPSSGDPEGVPEKSLTLSFRRKMEASLMGWPWGYLEIR